MLTFKQMREACWSGFKQVGMKKKGKKLVPNCVPEDAPANAVGDGSNVAMPPSHEPGVKVKKKKDDMKSHIMSFLKRFKSQKQINEMSASELASQASNDADLYRKQIEPIIKNLGRKKHKGVFNRDLAVKLFRYAIDNKVKEVKGSESRSVPGTVRNDAASRMLSSFSSEIDEFAKELEKKKK
tara:strand:+ start:1984 stop:2532 length:549 start_codon:yes stop_codon:yes gene_type:complete